MKGRNEYRTKKDMPLTADQGMLHIYSNLVILNTRAHKDEDTYSYGKDSMCSHVPSAVQATSAYRTACTCSKMTKSARSCSMGSPCDAAMAVRSS